MKAGFMYIALLALAIVVLPMVSLWLTTPKPPEEASVHTPSMPVEEQAASALEEPLREEAAPPAEEDEVIVVAEAEPETSASGVRSFRILDQATGRVEEVSLRDFVRGAVASEMPVSFHSEALKAQAVAAHTFALHNHYVQEENPDPALRGADFAADPSNMKVYITEETAKAFYGEDYAEVYWKKICEAADSVLPYILEYDEEPIVAAYHAISAGQTEAAENIWMGSADYLIPVASEGDYLAPDFEVSATLSPDAVRTALEAAYPGIDLSGAPESWFGDTVRSESGYIISVEAGGISIPGKELRVIFDLRSHNMDIASADGGFVFTTYGHGHGVGLSQYGADFMARQGYRFDEILSHYYSGAALRIAEGIG